MSECTVAIHVQSPPAALPRLLNRYFRIRGNSDGDTMRLPVTLDLPFGATSRILTVNVQPRAHARATTPAYSLFWIIDDLPSIPPFCGVLTIASGADDETSALTIRGTYTPALGIAGAALEILSGRSIAREIAASLLEDMKVGVSSATLAYA